MILTLINIVAIGFGGYALYRCVRIYKQIIKQKKENFELFDKIITRMNKIEKVTGYHQTKASIDNEM